MRLQHSGLPQFLVTLTRTSLACSVMPGKGENMTAFRSASAAMVTAIPIARLPITQPVYRRECCSARTALRKSHHRASTIGWLRELQTANCELRAFTIQTASNDDRYEDTPTASSRPRTSGH